MGRREATAEARIRFQVSGTQSVIKQVGGVKSIVAEMSDRVERFRTKGGLGALAVGQERIDAAQSRIARLGLSLTDTETKVQSLRLKLSEVPEGTAEYDRIVADLVRVESSAASLRSEIASIPRNLREDVQQTVGFLGDIDSSFQALAGTARTLQNVGGPIGGVLGGLPLGEAANTLQIAGDIAAAAEALPRLSSALATTRQRILDSVSTVGQQVAATGTSIAAERQLAVARTQTATATTAAATASTASVAASGSSALTKVGGAIAGVGAVASRVVPQLAALGLAYVAVDKAIKQFGVFSTQATAATQGLIDSLKGAEVAALDYSTVVDNYTLDSLDAARQAEQAKADQIRQNITQLRTYASAIDQESGARGVAIDVVEAGLSVFSESNMEKINQELKEQEAQLLVVQNNLGVLNDEYTRHAIVLALQLENLDAIVQFQLELERLSRASPEAIEGFIDGFEDQIKAIQSAVQEQLDFGIFFRSLTDDLRNQLQREAESRGLELSLPDDKGAFSVTVPFDITSADVDQASISSLGRVFSVLFTDSVLESLDDTQRTFVQEVIKYSDGISAAVSGIASALPILEEAKEAEEERNDELERTEQATAAATEATRQHTETMANAARDYQEIARAQETLTKAQDAYNKRIQDLFGENLIKAQRGLVESELQRRIAAAREREAADEELQKIADIRADVATKEASIIKDQAEARQDLETQFYKDSEASLKNYLKKLSRLRGKFEDDTLEAQLNFDLGAAARLERRFKSDKDQLAEDFSDEQATREEAFKEQLAELQDQGREQLAEVRRQGDERLQQLRKNGTKVILESQRLEQELASIRERWRKEDETRRRALETNALRQRIIDAQTHLNELRDRFRNTYTDQIQAIRTWERQAVTSARNVMNFMSDLSNVGRLLSQARQRQISEGATRLSNAIPSFAEGGIATGPQIVRVADNYPDNRELMIPMRRSDDVATAVNRYTGGAMVNQPTIVFNGGVHVRNDGDLAKLEMKLFNAFKRSMETQR